MQVENKTLCEQYAICVLDVLLKGFSNFQKGESPDYFNDSVGIEITKAISTVEGEIDAFWRKYHDKRLQEIPQKQLQKMGFVAPPVSENIIFYRQSSKNNGTLLYYRPKNTENLLLFARIGSLKTISAEDVKNAVDKKLKKLNSNYCVKPENDLALLVPEQLNYICVERDIVKETLEAAIEQIRNIYNKKEYAYYFNYLYLIFLDNLFVINTKEWKFKRKIISTRERDRIHTEMSKVVHDTEL